MCTCKPRSTTSPTSASAFSAIGSQSFFARTGPKTIATIIPTIATPSAIIETKPQEIETLAPFSLGPLGFIRIAPLGDAVNVVLQPGHLTFLPTSSSRTLSLLPQELHTTEIAMVQVSAFISHIFGCQIYQFDRPRYCPNHCKLPACTCPQV